MNYFKIEIKKHGFTEALFYNGKLYQKRYERDKYGYTGLDRTWEYEDELPDELVQALEDRDEIGIMTALGGG